MTVWEASGKPAGPYCPEEDLKTTAYISGGSSGTEDAPYLLPSNLSTDTCPVHTANDVEPIDITGETDGEETQPPVIDDDGGSDEPPDSHTGLEDEDQTMIYPQDVSD